MNFTNVTIKFKGMRKEEKFTVYPCRTNDKTIKIQSRRRIALIDFEKGNVLLSKGCSNGASFVMLSAFMKPTLLELSNEQLEQLKLGREAMGKISNRDRSVCLLGRA